MKYVILFLLIATAVSGCGDHASGHKLGISFGVGEAARWPYEMAVMVDHAEQLGLTVEARFNKGDSAVSQGDDCEELINGGISALIIVPRDASDIRKIFDQARRKNVKVIVYARAVHDESYDFFVGYDTYKIGRNLGSALAERVSRGDVAILKGDIRDVNAPALYDGAMNSLRPYVSGGDIRIIADEYVAKWSPDAAKATLMKAIESNNGKLDGVLAFNDILAGAAADVVRELELENKVVIVGMDAELSALRRLVRGEQDATIYMDLKAMATAAVDAAYLLINDRPIMANSKVETAPAAGVEAYLINGKVVTRENLDRLMIESGVYSRKDVYTDRPN